MVRALDCAEFLTLTFFLLFHKTTGVMPRVVCLICCKEFYVKPSHQSMGWGKYCSIACRTRGRLNGKNVICFVCGKTVYRSKKNLKNSASGKFFCDKSCQTIWRNTVLYSGENHPNWVFGESAYRNILKKTNRKQVCVLCKTVDKRILAVHHYDKNRQNNAISNLVWLCYNCHYLVHHDGSEKNKLKIMLGK